MREYFLLIPLLTLAISFSFLGSADAVTMDDALSYKQQLRDIYEEVCFGIAPGTRLTKEERDIRMVENAKFQLKAYHDDPVGLLRYWLDIYNKMADRFAHDISIKDPALSAWHARLISGIEDCRSITSAAMDIMARQQKPAVATALFDKDLASRIHQNATHFHALKKDLGQILLPLFSNQEDLKTFVREMPINLYIEQTWK